MYVAINLACRVKYECCIQASW